VTTDLANGGDTVSEVLEDAIRAYYGALERVGLLREEWERQGKPLLGVGSAGQDIPHALLKAIREEEMLADRLRDRIAKKHMGRPPEAVMQSFLVKPRITRNPNRAA
jgi:hypothetical protein